MTQNKEFIRYLSDCILESSEEEMDTKRSNSINGEKMDYIIWDILHTEWQGKSLIYTIRVMDEQSAFCQVIYKTFSEIMKLYSQILQNEDIKRDLPVFPKKRYILSGSTK